MISASLRLSPAIHETLLSTNARIVLVGTSGWLGQATLAMVDRAFDGQSLASRILPFGSKARTIRLPSGNTIHGSRLDDLGSLDLSDCIVLHFGYLAKDKTAAMSEDQYVEMNDAIHAEIMKAVSRTPPLGLFFASSGAVYQARDPGHPARDENLYGWMKAKHEAAFATAAETGGFSVINGRIFSLSGEFINKIDHYVLASLIRDLTTQRTIRLRSAHPVWRSYTYVGDVINFGLSMLIKREPSLCLDIAGREAIEIGALAQLCADTLGIDDVVVSRPRMPPGAPADRMIGDFERYDGLLRREGIEPLSLTHQIAATAVYLNGMARSTSDRT